MSTTVEELAAACAEYNLRTRIDKADGDQQRVDCLNIWREPLDRYPAVTVWAPFQGQGWTWGPHFEQCAPDTVGTFDLLARVLQTMPQD